LGSIFSRTKNQTPNGHRPNHAKGGQNIPDGIPEREPLNISIMSNPNDEFADSRYFKRILGADGSFVNLMGDNGLVPIFLKVIIAEIERIGKVTFCYTVCKKIVRDQQRKFLWIKTYNWQENYFQSKGN
jgi:hypothetical protein